MPIFGRPMAMMGQPPQEPWVFLGELKRDYNVKEVALNANRIDDDIKVLMVVHPRDITDGAQYAIDQFVLRGGKLVAFVDSYAYFDQMRNPANPSMQMGGGQSSLDKLFKAWGVGLEPGKVVADMRFMRRGGQSALPTLLDISAEGLNPNDVVTSQVGTMLIPFPGAFNGKRSPGLQETVLIKSSTSAQLQDAMRATQPIDPSSIAIKASGVEYPIAIRLSGKFKTAFPEGKPQEPKKEGEDPQPEAKPETQRKESAKDNFVILVADADLLSDQASVQVEEMLGQRIVIPRNGNLNFAQSLVEQFAGDDNLINLRARASQFRPLTVVSQMQARAANSYAGKIKDLEDNLQNTQRRIGELQKTKAEGQQQFILTSEQQAELESFRVKQAQTRTELKELRKDLRTETDTLEFWTKLINVGAMPLLVALAGIALALVKRRKVAAR